MGRYPSDRKRSTEQKPLRPRSALASARSTFARMKPELHRLIEELEAVGGPERAAPVRRCFSIIVDAIEGSRE